MKILMYCQYVWGMGHLFRSLELAKAFAPHRVTLVAGGQPVGLEVPGHIEMVRLPALYMDEKFTRLISGEPGLDLEAVKRQRVETLQNLLARVRPDAFVIELFPFGRTAFHFELLPVLSTIRDGKFGPLRTVCSLRDILVEKRDPAAYEARVLDVLNRYFDLLLVHSDERLLPLNLTFSRQHEIAIPVFYTGFVTRHPDPARLARLREALARPTAEKLIVASAGGGRSGFKLLHPVLQACSRLLGELPFRLEVFSGPFMDEGEFARLAELAAPGLRVRRFSGDFLEYLALADLSVSLAGYNTCMNLLATGVPALVLPYARQQEQPLRVEALQPHLPMRILSERDLAVDRLADHIRQMLQRERRCGPPALDLGGGRNSANCVIHWLKSSSNTGGN